jgi:glycosyltransferase involved in cell wall biosynthesis
VTLAFFGGGPERDSVFLANALAARGKRVTMLVLRDEGPLRALIDPAVCVTPVRAARMRYAVVALRQAIACLAPTIVVSSGVPSLNLVTLLAVRSLGRTRRPKLVLREGAVPSLARLDPSRQNRFAYRALRLLYRRADCITTLTEGARRDLIRDFCVPESIISVMPNAVLPPTAVDRLRTWNAEHGRERDLIVCVGRLSAEKDQHTLLRALTLLTKHRQCRLVLVGDGPNRSALEAFARQNGLANKTVFTGYVADPFHWMMRASVLVLPSLYEGFGNVIIEALACGTPVICTDCPYGPQELLAGGRYGTLTPVRDPTAMALAISKALECVPDRQLLRQRGFEHTAERAAAKFLDIISVFEPKPAIGDRSFTVVPTS